MNADEINNLIYATEEGWVLSEGKYGIIIEKDDDFDTFSRDDDAECFVSIKAAEGSLLHLNAIVISSRSWADHWEDQYRMACLLSEDAK